MSIRTKTIAIIVIPLICFIIAFYAVMAHFINSGFTAIEDGYTQANVKRVMSAIQNKVHGIARSASDWGNWDQSYHFMEGRNPNFTAEITPTSFKVLEINLIALIDRDGKVVLGKQFDSEKGVEVPLPGEFATLLAPTSALMKEAWQGTSGLMRTSDGILLVASKPILTTAQSWPMQGILVMGRYLDRKMIDDLKSTTGLSFELIPLGGQAQSSELANALAELNAGKSVVVERRDDDSITAYAKVDDIAGKPLLIIRIDLPRDVYEYGRTTMGLFIASLVGMGVIFLILVIVTLKRLVLDRIERLNFQAVKIGSTQTFSKRIVLPGADELSALADSINSMLEHIEKCQREIDKLTTQ